MTTRGWIRPLRERDFRLFFIGQSTSQLGSTMAPVAIAFAVLDHGTATDVGLVMASETIPLVVLLLVGGVFGDHMNRRTLMLRADLLRTFAECSLGLWVLLGHPPLWGFMVLAALLGIGQAFFSPSLTGIVPQLLSDTLLQQGNALNSLSYSGGAIVGPAFAGVIIASANPGWAILIDGITFFVSVLSLAMIKIDWAPMEHRESFTTLLHEGWRALWSRTWLWVIVVGASIVNMFFAFYFVLGPAVAKASLGGAPAWGLILAVEGVGAMAAGLIMLKLHPRRPLFLATVLLLAVPLPLLFLSGPSPLWAIAAAAFCCGGALTAFTVQWNTTMQREIEPHLLARVSAYDWFGSLVFMPVGMAIAGPTARLIGTSSALVLAGVVIAVVVLASLCVPSIRNLRAPAPPA